MVARRRRPAERPRELLSLLANFLGALPPTSSPSPALYSSTFSRKSGPASEKSTAFSKQMSVSVRSTNTISVS